jgi:hypothetical protein
VARSSPEATYDRRHAALARHQQTTANILWVTLPNGATKPINFDEKSQARLMTLSPGAVVSATYTESAAIQLEKLAR